MKLSITGSQKAFATWNKAPALTMRLVYAHRMIKLSQSLVVHITLTIPLHRHWLAFRSMRQDVSGDGDGLTVN